MIFYFTGTGNSLNVARQLAQLTDDSVVSIAEIMAGRPMPRVGEAVGIVYPVYAWSPPKMVLDFVRRHPIKAQYLYSVCTCGENCGQAMKRLEKAAGRRLDAAWSIDSPNNYMVGFDVDSPEEAAAKLAATDRRIPQIAQDLRRRMAGVYDVEEGSSSGLPAALAPPLFNLFARSARAYYVQDTCTGCGKCASVCPTRNIRVTQKPRWGRTCAACFACINHCPVRAIQRGRGTLNKGRYVHPGCPVAYHFD